MSTYFDSLNPKNRSLNRKNITNLSHETHSNLGACAILNFLTLYCAIFRIIYNTLYHWWVIIFSMIDSG